MRMFQPVSPMAWLTLGLTVSLAACNAGNPNSDANPAVAHAHKKSYTPPVDITRIDLGKTVASDSSSTAFPVIFRPTDTIHAVVTSEGAAKNVAMMAKWLSPNGGVVSKSEQTINPKGTQRTSFELMNKTALPAGQYTLEIDLNGQAAATIVFSIGK